MDNYRISKNYAKALFLLANNLDQVATVAQDMRLVADVFAANHELYVVFNNPVIKQSKKSAIIAAIFENKVSNISMQFLLFVVRKNRIVNVRGIANAFLNMYRDSRGIVLADLTTAHAVDAEITTMVAEMVGHITNSNVEVASHVDRRIIGGFVVKFNNKMFDSRIRTKIAELRRQFSANEYESKL